jgi:SNF2 family DNA or RNA helicase
MVSPTVTKDWYIEVADDRIRAHPKTAHTERLSSTIAVWRTNSHGLYWELPATPSSAELLASLIGDQDIECDQQFMELYERSQDMVAARPLRTDETLEDHPSRRPSWLHQRQAYRFGYPLDGFGLWADMGTGKSKVVVDLVSNRQHWLTLIVAPKKAVNVWPRQFRDYAVREDIEVITLGGKGDHRSIAERAQVIRDRTRNQDHPLVFVTTYQSFNHTASEPMRAAVTGTIWDMVVADEAHNLSAPKSKLGLYFGQLGRRVPYRMGLSGTPEKKGPLDIWGIYRFLDPGVFGTSYYRFRDQYAVMDRMFPSKVKVYVNLDDFAARMYSIAFRVTADVLDLPEVHNIHVSVRISAEAKAKHDQMKADLIARTDDGVAVAENVLTKFLRMQQITGGHLTVADEDENAVVSRVDFAKLDELQGILEEVPNREYPLDYTGERHPEPVVVFCRFVAELDDIKGLAQEMGIRYGELSGRRDDLNLDAQMPEDIDILAVQIQAGGVGVDLTRAHYGVYYSKGYSLVDYEQSWKRLHRPGQTRPVTLYHLVAEGTVDEHVERAIQQKIDIVQYVWDQIGEDHYDG